MKNDLHLAVDLALSGEWTAAHAIVQRHEGEPNFDWVHAVLHKLEGDPGNSRHWYHACNRLDHERDDPQMELQQIRQHA